MRLTAFVFLFGLRCAFQAGGAAVAAAFDAPLWLAVFAGVLAAVPYELALSRLAARAGETP